jgi:hypothetical protein
MPRISTALDLARSGSVGEGELEPRGVAPTGLRLALACGAGRVSHDTAVWTIYDYVLGQVSLSAWTTAGSGWTTPSAVRWAGDGPGSVQEGAGHV